MDKKLKIKELEHQIDLIIKELDDLYDELEDDGEKAKEQRLRTFNGLSAKEWASLSRSVWNDVSSSRGKSHLIHGATYPEKLCTRLIKMYSKENDIVLDPFLGTGTTAKAALKGKRDAIGIELTEKYYKIAQNEINSIVNDNVSLFEELNINNKYTLYHGDCIKELNKIGDEQIQLTITSPPYADLIHKVEDDRKNRHKNSAFVIDNNAKTNLYSDLENDLGNMSFEPYLEAVEKVMKQLFRVTKKGGYNIWVVKDYRDLSQGIPYVDLHSSIARVGEAAGFKLQDYIIWDQNQHRRLVLLGYPSRFYVNQNNSYIVVFRKW